MSNTYKHRQIGTLMGVIALFVMLLGLILVRTLSLRGEQYSWLIVGLPLLITVITLALFSVLEVSIDARHLTWRFLPFITKSVPLADVLEAKPTRTSFIYGWGIHYTDRGWLYNVSGFSAVHIRMRDGKQFMLGSDEPAALADAINSSRAYLPLS